MTLSEQQLAYFNVFGYLRFPGLFADDISEITKHFNAVFEQFEGDVVKWVHETHENRLRRFITNATEKDEYLASLLEDPRIKDVASSLLGHDYGFNGCDLSIYDWGTLFHQDGIDTAKPGRTNIKMALYLDQLDEASGAVRVIPGSHLQGDKFANTLIKNWFGPDKLGLKTEEYPAVVLSSAPGDLMLWNYRLMHATAYGGNQRRMMALEFSGGS